MKKEDEAYLEELLALKELKERAHKEEQEKLRKMIARLKKGNKRGKK